MNIKKLRKNSFQQVYQQGLVAYLHKLTDLKSLQYKQKQMEFQQNTIRKEDIRRMAIQMFKQKLNKLGCWDENQVQEFENDEKINAFLQCIDELCLIFKDGLTSSNQQIRELTKKDKQNNINLAMLQNELYDVKCMMQNLQNESKQYAERLNQSEHQIQSSRHSISQKLIQQSYLQQQINQKKTKNENLFIENKQLKQAIDKLKNQLQKNQTQNISIKYQLEKLRQEHTNFQLVIQSLSNEKNVLQSQNINLQQVIDEKQQLLKFRMNRQDINLSADRDSYINLINVVKEENQSYGSDKQIMKNIEQNLKNQPITALKFNDSKPISENSQSSEENALQIQNISNNFPFESPQAQRKKISLQKRVQTERKNTKAKPSKKKTQKQSNAKIIKNTVIKKIQLNKESLRTPLAKRNNKAESIKSKTKQIELKQQIHQKQKLQLLNRTTPESMFTHETKSVRNRQASFVSHQPKKGLNNQRLHNQRLHNSNTQSMQDLFDQRKFTKEDIQVKLKIRQKELQDLKSQNRSVKQDVIQKENQLNKAEQVVETLTEQTSQEVSFYKNQLNRMYLQHIIIKAQITPLQRQIQKLTYEKVQYLQLYKKLTQKLKTNCYCSKAQSTFNNDNIYEQQRFECDQIFQDQPFSQKKQFDRNFAFHKQIYHHSIKNSNFSEIQNDGSKNHSKNTSFINLDEEDIQSYRSNQHEQTIKIVENYNHYQELQAPNTQELTQLYSYRKKQDQQSTKLTQQQEVQTQIQYQSFQNKNQSQEISYSLQYSSFCQKSYQETQKTKFAQQKTSIIKNIKIQNCFTLFIQPKKIKLLKIENKCFFYAFKDLKLRYQQQTITNRRQIQKQSLMYVKVQAQKKKISDFQSQTIKKVCNIQRLEDIHIGIINKINQNYKTQTQTSIIKIQSLQKMHIQPKLSLIKICTLQNLIIQPNKNFCQQSYIQTQRKQLNTYKQQSFNILPLVRQSFLQKQNQILHVKIHNQDKQCQTSKQNQFQKVNLSNSYLQTQQKNLSRYHQLNIKILPLVRLLRIQKQTRIYIQSLSNVQKHDQQCQISQNRVESKQIHSSNFLMQTQRKQLNKQDQYKMGLSPVVKLLSICQQSKIYIQPSIIKKETKQCQTLLTKVEQTQTQVNIQQQKQNIQMQRLPFISTITQSDKQIGQILVSSVFDGPVKISKGSTNYSTPNRVEFGIEHDQTNRINITPYWEVAETYHHQVPYSVQRSVNRSNASQNKHNYQQKTFNDQQNVINDQQNTINNQQNVNNNQYNVINEGLGCQFRHSNQLQLKQYMELQNFQFLTQKQRSYLCKHLSSKKKYQLKEIVHLNRRQDICQRMQEYGIQSTIISLQNSISRLSKKQTLLIECNSNSPLSKSTFFLITTRYLICLTSLYTLKNDSQTYFRSQRLIFGNHQVMLYDNKLCLYLKNKFNYFRVHQGKGDFNTNQEYQVINLFRFVKE